LAPTTTVIWPVSAEALPGVGDGLDPSVVVGTAVGETVGEAVAVSAAVVGDAAVVAVVSVTDPFVPPTPEQPAAATRTARTRATSIGRQGGVRPESSEAVGMANSTTAGGCFIIRAISAALARR